MCLTQGGHGSSFLLICPLFNGKFLCLGFFSPSIDERLRSLNTLSQTQVLQRSALSDTSNKNYMLVRKSLGMLVTNVKIESLKYW